MVLLFLAGGAGAFLLVRSLAGLSAGVSAAGFFLLTPYHFVNLYVRGDLSELMASLLTPWPLFGLVILERSVGEGRPCWKGSLVLGLGLACVVVSHPITAFFLVPILVCTAGHLISRHAQATRSLLIMELLMAFVLGLAASAFYWVHVLLMTSHTILEQVGTSTSYFGAYRHVVDFSQLLSRAWGFGFSAPESLNDGMSFQLGLPHFLLALSGLAMGRRNRLTLLNGALYLLLILLMTPLAKWFWQIPFLAPVQFPWRILSVTAILQVVCVLGWFDRTAFRPRWFTPALGCVALVLALLGVFFWQPAIRRVEGLVTVHPSALDSIVLRCRQTAGFQPSANDPRANPWRFRKLLGRAPSEAKTNPPDLEEISTSALALARATREGFYNLDRGEWLPRTARPEQLPGPRRELLLIPVGDRPTAGAEDSPYHIRCRFAPTAGSRTVIINQLYLPGWRVRLNGVDVPTEELENQLMSDGRMQVVLPSAEACQLEAWHDGPPLWRTRALLVVLALCAWLAFRYFRHRQSSR